MLESILLCPYVARALACLFEGRGKENFAERGLSTKILQPGELEPCQSNGRYLPSSKAKKGSFWAWPTRGASLGPFPSSQATREPKSRSPTKGKSSRTRWRSCSRASLPRG